jgi:hypothetical protein
VLALQTTFPSKPSLSKKNEQRGSLGWGGYSQNPFPRLRLLVALIRLTALMQSKATIVRQYLAELPAERRSIQQKNRRT